MDEVLTLEEIEKRFDGEWVLVGDPELTEMNEVIRGTVLAHSKDRDEVYHKALELRPKNAATLCLRKIPEGTGVLL